MKKTISFAILLTISWTAFAEVKLPALFSDNMVLQQNFDAPVWGWADPGEKVSVKGSWQLLGGSSATADKNGKWNLTIKTPKASGPFTLTVKGKNVVKINNVLIGEVWICSGQSNMQMNVSPGRPWHKGAFNYPNEIAAANFPDIRMFTVKQATAQEPKSDCEGSWAICSPETVGSFSAAGYFFAHELHKELGIGFGMIHTSWGGTPAEAWTSAEYLMQLPDYAAFFEKMQNTDSEQAKEEYEKALVDWWKDLEAADIGKRQTPEGWQNSQLDDADWKIMSLPKLWEEDLPELDGSVWFRKAIDIPASWTGKDLTLELAAIDDMDITWFNGTEVGAHETLGYYNTPRKYNVPASVVKTGQNVIAVRVVDNTGAGGIFGEAEFKIRPADKSSEAITLAGDWKFKVGLDLKDLRGMPLSSRLAKNQNTPTMLYNAMIAPLIPYSVKGAIWYQGESNTGRAYQYRSLFPKMIECWRNDWAQGDFPFYFTQIAPFNYGTEYICPELQEAQLMTLSVPNTGMAVTMDIGNIYDIHPRNKQLVGKRLALWALAKDYCRKDLVYSGPLYSSMQKQGDKIRIFFDHTGSGLVHMGGPVSHLTIAGKDKVFVKANSEIENNTLVVSSPEVKEPVAVRYAWSNTAVPNLFNFEGLPASPFRTDDWPGVTFDKK